MKTEFFQNGVRFVSSPGQFALGTDAMVLADFVAPEPHAAVCDLCAGSGAVGLLLLAKEPGLTVTAVELQEVACRAARENAAANDLTERLRVVQGDLREIKGLLPANGFRCVVCNPPYYPVGAGFAAKDEALAVARTELCCTLSEVCAAAAWLLQTGGSFYLVHRAERLADVVCCLREHKLEPKQLRLVRHGRKDGYSLLLCKAVLGGKPGVQCLPELVLFEDDGSPSEEYRRIYHIK